MKKKKEYGKKATLLLVGSDTLQALATELYRMQMPPLFCREWSEALLLLGKCHCDAIVLDAVRCPVDPLELALNARELAPQAKIILLVPEKTRGRKTPVGENMLHLSRQLSAPVLAERIQRIIHAGNEDEEKNRR